MVHAALLLLMLEAVTTDLVFTISLKRSTQNLQLSTSWAGRLHHLSGVTRKTFAKAELFSVWPQPDVARPKGGTVVSSVKRDGTVQ
jgi:hypothetical protein